MSSSASRTSKEGPAARVLRWLRTYRHFSASQLLGRLAAGLRRSLHLTRIPDAPAGLTGSLEPRCSFLYHDPWNCADAIRRGRITFLNRPREMGEPWDWEAAGMSLLWRFHLHYFDYLHLLDPEERAQLATKWSRSNPPGNGVGWHPYPTSRRIANWCRLFGPSAPAEVQESLYRQAGYLRRNLETYLSGNHLLENARALVLAGVYFGPADEAPRWLETGMDLYRRELPRQFLSDGGHYERSPMYHAQVLHGCLDVLNAVGLDHEISGSMSEAVRRGLRYLHGVSHPDGDISLFNDATFDGAPAPRRLAAYASSIGDLAPGPMAVPTGLTEFADTGFFRYERGPFTLVLDAGPLGVSHQPSHGHADIFSYELSVGGDRFITDTGVYAYRAGDMRRYCRGTRAHNTLEVDGLDQVELWGNFRVARRFEPVVEKVTADAGAVHFLGRYDGYSELVGDEILHRRELACDGTDGVLEVEDRIEGRRVHDVRSRIHLHPEVAVTETPKGLQLRRGDVALRLESPAPLVVTSGWYCPRFGVRIQRSVVQLGGALELPTQLSYRISVVQA